MKKPNYILPLLLIIGAWLGASTTQAALSGSVVVWGRNSLGATSMVPVAAQSGVTAIAAGRDIIVVLKTNGSVVAWGIGFWQTNVPVTAQSGVTAIAAGGWGHTVALKNDGSVLAWGDSGYGETDVPIAALSGVTAIAAGGFRTVALLGTAVSLDARRSGNELILSWPTSAAGFTLQSTLALTPPVTWIDSINAPAVLGAQFTVTNTFSGSARIYRLRKL